MPENEEISEEFCPRCEAILTLQKGYDNQLPYWVCRGCGEMLINPEIDSVIVWICDQCESMLNQQEGFSEDCGSWKCLICGHKNTISESNFYLSEEEYRMSHKNHYKGMSDQDMLEVMSLEELGYMNDREDMLLVKDEDEHLYVKKYLSIFDESVYRFLIEHPVANMPRVFAAYKSDNYLVVIEEYVEGITLEEFLFNRNSSEIEAAPLEKDVAVTIVLNLSLILAELHSLLPPIIHRDVKPSNIMLTEEGEVYLLDVNVAKWAKADAIEDTRLLGTMNYAAPEQFGYGMTASTVKTDIYGLGILLNLLLTGCMPKVKRAPEPVWELVSQCISLEPERRPSDEELILKLYELLE